MSYNTTGKALAAKNYLLSGRTLTQKQAIKRFCCYRLAVVVERMRKDGIDVVTEKIQPMFGERFFVYYVAKVIDL
jgi:hypothetical protein